MANTSQTIPPLTSSLRPKLPGEQTALETVAYQLEFPISVFGLEFSIVLGLLLLVGVFIIVIRFSTREKSGSELKYTAQFDQTPQAPQSFVGSSRQQSGRFDAETAKHLPASKVLQGKAWVTDGDTIVINKTQIRLFGIDAPELDHPFGQKAKWAMVKLCKGHKIQAVVTDIDHYGRTVAHCTLSDGRDLSAELVKIGLAIDWPKYSGGKYKHLEVAGVRKRLWLADARQTGKMYLWEQYAYEQLNRQRR